MGVKIRLKLVTRNKTLLVETPNASTQHYNLLRGGGDKSSFEIRQHGNNCIELFLVLQDVESSSCYSAAVFPQLLEKKLA